MKPDQIRVYFGFPAALNFFSLEVFLKRFCLPTPALCGRCITFLREFLSPL